MQIVEPLLALVCEPLPLVRATLALVGKPLPLIRRSFAVGCAPVALIGQPVSSVYAALTPRELFPHIIEAHTDHPIASV
jgi:hypothetical protein